MKLLTIASSLLATLASACVQEGRACAAGGEKCCLRRSCVSNTQGSSLGFCVSLDADSLLQQPMPTAAPAAPAASPAMGGAGGAAGQPMNGGMAGGMPNGNGNAQMPAPAEGMNAGQPANPNNAQQGNNGGMFPVGGAAPQGVTAPQGLNSPVKANTGSAPPFFLVPTEN
ncbi:hypothetical protein PG993_006049 [Apiospora rasikravindrae]|uniref:Uncharacterized protein n=1 Tax=Apiospora rasikravindrae TaxID=990691 RepID=A0ABR1TAH5_9PEZI